jgi:hypothetical protein
MAGSTSKDADNAARFPPGAPLNSFAPRPDIPWRPKRIRTRSAPEEPRRLPTFCVSSLTGPPEHPSDPPFARLWARLVGGWQGGRHKRSQGFGSRSKPHPVGPPVVPGNGAERAGAPRPPHGASPDAAPPLSSCCTVVRLAPALRRPHAGDAPWRLPQGASAQPRSPAAGRRGPQTHVRGSPAPTQRPS